MKKAQSMSLNVIVIAALVILVLIVLAVIFIRNTGGFNTKLQSCIAQGGVCKPACGDVAYGTEDYTVANTDAKCPTETVCCLKI